MRPAFKYIIFILVFAFLGFTREFLFVNINNQLYKLYYGHSNLPLPGSLHFIANLSYSTLYYSKFTLTVLFYTAYFFVSFWTVRQITANKKFTLYIIYIYALLLILAGLTMVYNYTVNKQLDGDEYIFSRWLLGIAQSPLVAFFIIASAALYKKGQKKD